MVNFSKIKTDTLEKFVWVFFICCICIGASTYICNKFIVKNVEQLKQTIPQHKIAVLDIAKIVKEKLDAGADELSTVMFVQKLSIALQEQGYLVLDRQYVIGHPVKYAFETPTEKELEYLINTLNAEINDSTIEQALNKSKQKIQSIITQ